MPNWTSCQGVLSTICLQQERDSHPFDSMHSRIHPNVLREKRCTPSSRVNPEYLLLNRIV